MSFFLGGRMCKDDDNNGEEKEGGKGVIYFTFIFCVCSHLKVEYTTMRH